MERYGRSGISEGCTSTSGSWRATSRFAARIASGWLGCGPTTISRMADIFPESGSLRDSATYGVRPITPSRNRTSSQTAEVGACRTCRRTSSSSLKAFSLKDGVSSSDSKMNSHAMPAGSAAGAAVGTRSTINRNLSASALTRNVHRVRRHAGRQRPPGRRPDGSWHVFTGGAPAAVDGRTGRA